MEFPSKLRLFAETYAITLPNFLLKLLGKVATGSAASVHSSVELMAGTTQVRAPKRNMGVDPERGPSPYSLDAIRHIHSKVEHAPRQLAFLNEYAVHAYWRVHVYMCTWIHGYMDVVRCTSYVSNLCLGRMT